MDQRKELKKRISSDHSSKIATPSLVLLCSSFFFRLQLPAILGRIEHLTAIAMGKAVATTSVATNGWKTEPLSAMCMAFPGFCFHWSYRAANFCEQLRSPSNGSKESVALRSIVFGLVGVSCTVPQWVYSVYAIIFQALSVQCICA